MYPEIPELTLLFSLHRSLGQLEHLCVSEASCGPTCALLCWGCGSPVSCPVLCFELLNCSTCGGGILTETKGIFLLKIANVSFLHFGKPPLGSFLRLAAAASFIQAFQQAELWLPYISINTVLPSATVCFVCAVFGSHPPTHPLPG